MAEIVGKILEILEIPEVSNLYQTSIRKMQPAELVRRLESEKVSTRGHMPELRGRLLRLEIKKSHPHMQVPWYPEDNVSRKIQVKEQVKPNSERAKDDLLNKFFQTARYQEQKIRDMQSQANKTVRSDKANDKPQTASEKNSDVQKEYSLEAVIDKLDAKLQAYMARWGDTPVGNPQKPLPKPAIEQSKLDEKPEPVFDENQDDEDEETSTIRSAESIAKLNFDNESFEKVDAESVTSWDNDSWCGSSSTSAYRITEVD